MHWLRQKNNYIMNTDFKENIETISEWIGDHVRQTYSHGETRGQDDLTVSDLTRKRRT